MPGEYSLLSIGACEVGRSDRTFYVELRPINGRFVPEALTVSQLDLKTLSRDGTPPPEAMRSFDEWISRVSDGRSPVFVGFNATFDWSFVNWYFHKFRGQNPFGIGGVDIKAFAMGLMGRLWCETTSSHLPQKYQSELPKTHNALDDALSQGDTFQKLLNESRRTRA